MLPGYYSFQFRNMNHKHILVAVFAAFFLLWMPGCKEHSTDFQTKTEIGTP